MRAIQQSMSDLDLAPRDPEEERKREEQRMELQRAQERIIPNLELDIPTDCAICFTTITQPALLPCKHILRVECTKMSLNYKRECPICKFRPPANFVPEVNADIAR